MPNAFAFPDWSPLSRNDGDLAGGHHDHSNITSSYDALLSTGSLSLFSNTGMDAIQGIDQTPRIVDCLVFGHLELPVYVVGAAADGVSQCESARCVQSFGFCRSSQR